MDRQIDYWTEKWMACWFLDLFEKSVFNMIKQFFCLVRQKIFLNTRSRIWEKEEGGRKGQKEREKKMNDKSSNVFAWPLIVWTEITQWVFHAACLLGNSTPAPRCGAQSRKQCSPSPGGSAHSSAAWGWDRDASLPELEYAAIWSILCAQLLQTPALQKAGDVGRAPGNSKEQLIIQSIFGESSGSICLPQARSTNSPTQLPFIPRQVRGQFLKHCWTQQRWCTGLIFLDLLIQPVSLAFRGGESGQEALNEPSEAPCRVHCWGLWLLKIISGVRMDRPTRRFFVRLPSHFGRLGSAAGESNTLSQILWFAPVLKAPLISKTTT